MEAAGAVEALLPFLATFGSLDWIQSQDDKATQAKWMSQDWLD